MQSWVTLFCPLICQGRESWVARKLQVKSPQLASYWGAGQALNHECKVWVPCFQQGLAFAFWEEWQLKKGENLWCAEGRRPSFLAPEQCGYSFLPELTREQAERALREIPIKLPVKKVETFLYGSRSVQHVVLTVGAEYGI